MKLEQPEGKKGILGSIRKTVAMGTIAGASLLASITPAKGAEQAHRDLSKGKGGSAQAENAKTPEVKFDSTYINNFAKEIKDRTLKTIVENDTIDSDRKYEALVREIENFYTMVSFAGDLSEIDQKSLANASSSISFVLEKMKEKIADTIEDIQDFDESLRKNPGNTEVSSMRLRQDERAIDSLKKTSAKIDKLVTKLKGKK